MPYIQELSRRKFDKIVDLMFDTGINFGKLTKSELNYLITKIIHSWVKKSGVGYNVLSDARAVLSDVKDEFTRQVVHPYEDKKKEQNGHISELDK